MVKTELAAHTVVISTPKGIKSMARDEYTFQLFRIHEVRLDADP